MGARSKRKGKRGELEAAKAVARLFGVESRRGRQYAGTPDAPDIVTGIRDVHFEVKRCERLSLYAALDQAKAESNGIPVVLHRTNDRPWVAIVPLDQLPDLAVVLYLTLAGEK